jgi:hypothetical protein
LLEENLIVVQAFYCKVTSNFLVSRPPNTNKIGIKQQIDCYKQILLQLRVVVLLSMLIEAMIIKEGLLSLPLYLLVASSNYFHHFIFVFAESRISFAEYRLFFHQFHLFFKINLIYSSIVNFATLIYLI